MSNHEVEKLISFQFSLIYFITLKHHDFITLKRHDYTLYVKEIIFFKKPNIKTCFRGTFTIK